MIVRVDRPKRAPIRNRGGRAFPGTRDDAHRQAVKQRTCLLRGKTSAPFARWRGVYPNTVRETVVDVHVCGWGIDPHHVDKLSQGGHDHSAVPLCRVGHNDAEKLRTVAAFKKKWGVDLKVEARKLAPKRRTPRLVALAAKGETP